MNKQSEDSQEMIDAKIKSILSSPFLLVHYLHLTHRRIDIGKDGSMCVECPCLDCHGGADPLKIGQGESLDYDQIAQHDESVRKHYSTARIAQNRITGVYRLVCECCKGEWDIIKLFEADNKCTQETAIKTLLTFAENATIVV